MIKLQTVASGYISCSDKPGFHWSNNKCNFTAFKTTVTADIPKRKRFVTIDNNTIQTWATKAGLSLFASQKATT